MRTIAAILMASAAWPALAQAQSADPSPEMPQRTESARAAATDKRNDRDIVVTAGRESSGAALKTDTPITQTPQHVSIIDDDTYLAQGAVSVADTLRYVSGVQANNYGPDSRVDGSFIRGITPLQFRDGMRDIFSYYASIRADPYNFSRVEVVRGPASVLFGTSSIGGLINLVSKRPRRDASGEVSVRYGSFDRKEILADVTGPVTDQISARMVARVRDAGTQTDHVPDDRVMVAPSLRWQPSDATDLTLIGLYQEDDGGSTQQFLPLVGTLFDNPNGRIPDDTFIGKPGWDRYDGRLLQGTAILDQQLGDGIDLSLKARYIDSDLTYLSHYPDSYSDPTNPYVQLDPATGMPVVDPDTGTPLRDPDQRTIGLYADGSRARLNVFSTDNNVRFDFDTGDAVSHMLLAGIDYSWNSVHKVGGFGFDYIDIYDPDYTQLSDFGGGLPPGASVSEDSSQKQLGFYVQDQVRLWDRVSVVLGARRDHVRSEAIGAPSEEANATSFRAGIIGELLPGVSPFFSYTESFQPISGTTSSGNPFKPKRGKQFEAGVKFQPDAATLLTATAYHIDETNRPIDDASTPDPTDQIQAGSLTSKGFELEARRTLPGDFQIIANYSYVKAEIDGTDHQLENVPKHNASLWATKTFALKADTSLRIGSGVRYVGANRSYGPAFPDGVRTPDRTLVDALVALNWRKWRLSVNATNLFDEHYYAACLARGDCFLGANRNVFATLTYSF